MKRKTVAPVDYVIIVAVLLVAFLIFALSFFVGGNGKKVVVSVNNNVVCEMELSKNAQQKIKTESGYNIVKVEDGKCSVIEANCKDKLCKKRGVITKKGESIVCLPHLLIVEIK